MIKRLTVLVPVALLALSLTACGSDDEPADTDQGSSQSTPDDSGDSGDSGDSDSSDDSEDESSDDVTGADYAALATALFSVDGPDGGFTSADQLNELGDFPDGVSVASYDRESENVCIQDENLDIAFGLTSEGDEPGFELLDGLCDDGDQVALLTEDPDDDQNLLIDGDEDLAAPVVDAITNTL